jgi:energy-coupling factor transport system permease protein
VSNPGASRRTWHAVTWLVWAIAAAAAVQLAPSPVYVALVIGVAALVVETHALNTPFARAFPLLLTLGLVFAVVRIVIAVTTAHGLGDVLFTTPHFTLPTMLGGFTVGGTVELPVLLQAATEGFAVVGVIAAFAAFNAVVSHYELVQSAPRAFYELGLVLVVALAFVPSTIGAINAVREADRARTGGRVVRRGRMLRLVVPILESGLERAIALSESMDSRGFAHERASRRDIAAGWCGLGALLALGATFVALVGQARGVAVGLGVLGAFLLVTALWLASTAHRRDRYRPRPITAADLVVMGVSIVAPVALALLSVAGDDSLVWNVSPLAWPAFHVLPALAIAALLAPMVRRPALAISTFGTERALQGPLSHKREVVA